MKSVTKEKVFHVLKLVLLAVTVTLVLLSLLGTVAHASGLVDDTVNADNLYSKYPLSNYQLDFYVDNSWSWLPWNWLDGIGKSVQYGLYCITNFVWTISLYLSNATGYVVQQAYKLDFINDMADSIGKSIQTLAGVTENGFSSSGFYVGFLLIIILIVGVYTAYTGLLKRETSKALHAVINFVVVFIVSASFIAYAPNYIQKINDFSSDISTASLDLGTKIMLPDSQSKGKDSVDLIRDSLFAIQVEKPWLLLQFGNSDTEEIGTDRVEALVSASPSDEDGETRENIVKTEIEDNDNDNLTIPQVVNRLGMVFFLLIFNLGITIFIFLLTGMMLFSQILFIIYAMFLPISFLLSMIPTYENMAKQAVVRVFNAIMTRAGITLIVTVAFSISSMFYNISTDYPFFMVAFLQIICFAGIYMKLGELMSMFSLNANDSQQIGRRIFRRPMVFMRHRARRMEHRIARAVGAGSVAGAMAGASVARAGKPATNQPPKKRENNVRYTLTDGDTEYSYYYTHNSRGDIVGIYNGAGELKSHYEYDAWGNVISITDNNGNVITNLNHIGNLNPFRYRGYYQDTETGLYYLMSRYYDAVTHRFINADGYFQSGTSILDENTFAYCGNNPVSRADTGGDSWFSDIAATVVESALTAMAAICPWMGSNSSTSVSHISETKLINSDYAPVNFRCGGKTTTNISTHTYSLGSPTAYYNQDLYSYSDNYGNRNSGITHTFGVKSLSLDISMSFGSDGVGFSYAKINGDISMYISYKKCNNFVTETEVGFTKWDNSTGTTVYLGSSSNSVTSSMLMYAASSIPSIVGAGTVFKVLIPALGG